MAYKRVVITQHGSSEVLKLIEDDLAAAGRRCRAGQGADVRSQSLI